MGPAGISSLRFQVSGFRFQIPSPPLPLSPFPFTPHFFRFQVSGFRFQIPLAPLFIGKKIGIWDINYQ